LPRALPRAMRDKKIRQALQWAQLESLHDARAKTLSGGEKQRVALARAWLRQARVLLLDEPIANMDGESQARTVALLQRLKDAGAALLIASHNTDAFCRLVERHLVLACGKLHAVDGDADGAGDGDGDGGLSRHPRSPRLKHCGGDESGGGDGAGAGGDGAGKGDGAGNITAVVLAGGRATRMGGVDKGLVVFRGRPLAAGIGAALAMQTAVAEVVINANRNIAKYRGLGYRVVEDRLPDHQGPLAGMHAALLSATGPWLLTIPCDGPFVAGDYAQRMHAAAIDAGAKLAVAHDGARMQPVYSLIHRDLSDDLEQFLQSGQRKIDKWHARHAFATVDFSATPEMFTNINTAEELAELESD